MHIIIYPHKIQKLKSLLPSKDKHHVYYILYKLLINQTYQSIKPKNPNRFRFFGPPNLTHPPQLYLQLTKVNPFLFPDIFLSRLRWWLFVFPSILVQLHLPPLTPIDQAQKIKKQSTPRLPML